MKAKYIKTIDVIDDEGFNVELEVYKHQNGGLFAIDSSFLEQVADEDENGNAVIPDPMMFNELRYLTLIEK